MKNVREGYKMTELGEIPHEWEVNNGFIKIKSGFGFKLREYELEGIPLIRINNVMYGEIINEDLCYLPCSYLNNYKEFVLKKGDVLLALNRPITNNKLKIGKITEGPSILYQRVGKLEMDGNRYHSDFYFHYMQSESFINRLNNSLVGTDQPYIKTSEFENLKFVVPTLEEQEKIASILSTVDEQINNVEALIKKNKELKKGLMQTLLTKGIGHAKFKKTEIGEIPEEWEVSSLESRIEIRSGNSPSDFKLSENGKYPFFKVDDMNYSNKYINNSKVYFDECKFNLMTKGMVIFPKRGASIFTNKVGILNLDGYFDTNIMGVKCKEGLYNEYLFYQLKFIGLEKFADTTAVPQINNKHINPLKIPIPLIKEQETIVSILSEVDSKIEKYENKKVKLEELKRGLMQQLLTGNIRTI